ncbi:MAG: S41 family peptidase [Planctomycetota bacterium]|jgi:carboxyl-terminal processing protease
MSLERPARRLLLWILLLGLSTWTCNATAAPPLPLDLDDSRSALSIGEELERSGHWLDAIQHYDQALDRWPENVDLKYGRRRARVHFRIERRYADASFQQSLVAMSRTQALDLFDETTSRIRANFVEPLSYLSVVAHGTESFYIALANPEFLDENLSGLLTSEQRKAGVRELRHILRERYWNKPVHNSQHARQIVLEVTRHADETLKLPATAVVMEYVFGGCNSLDDYSGFLTSDRLADLYSNIDGEFVGLGVEMKEETGNGMLLVNVLPESPAAVGGLRKGDRILEIDGADIRNASIDDAASRMRGQSGSRVRLVVRRDAEGRTWDTVLIRRAVVVKSIPELKIVDHDHGIAYLQIAGFQKSTGRELDAALASLQSQGMRSLIVDVRGNPGGLLTAAVEVLDRFIEQGTLVATKGRTSDQNWTYRAHREGTFDLPIVLLTDGDSASASEIVAGAIRDHRRGTIVGRKTFGKWSVQSIFNIGSSNGLRLTTAKFYSPNGHTLSKIGVEPDVLVELPSEHTVAYRSSLFEDDESDADIERAIEILKRKGRRF